MSKWVNIRCIGVKEVMVEIDDNETIDAAIKIASEEMFDYDDFTGNNVKESSVDSYKRNADEVFAV